MMEVTEMEKKTGSRFRALVRVPLCVCAILVTDCRRGVEFRVEYSFVTDEEESS